MNRLYLNLVRGTDRPDMIVADNNYYRLYMEALQPQQRFTQRGHWRRPGSRTSSSRARTLCSTAASAVPARRTTCSS
jgi:hypothetical protein